MTVILPKSRFLHVPKTGGSWISRALTKATPTPRHLLFEAHLSYKKAPGRGLATFISIRKPEGYYRSYWAYRMRKGWTDHPLDRCRADDFRTFINNVLAYNPSFYSDLLRDKYYDPAGTILLRFDNLQQELIDVLELIGEEFSEEAIRNTGRQNTSDYKKYTAVLDDEQRAQILEANEFATELYQRSQNPKEHLQVSQEAPIREVTKAQRLFYFLRDYLTIRSSGEFDRDHYIEQRDHGARQRTFPLMHFVYRGERDGMTPNRVFQLLDYVNANPEIIWAQPVCPLSPKPRHRRSVVSCRRDALLARQKLLDGGLEKSWVVLCGDSTNPADLVPPENSILPLAS